MGGGISLTILANRDTGGNRATKGAKRDTGRGPCQSSLVRVTKISSQGAAAAA